MLPLSGQLQGQLQAVHVQPLPAWWTHCTLCQHHLLRLTLQVQLLRLRPCCFAATQFCNTTSGICTSISINDTCSWPFLVCSSGHHQRMGSSNPALTTTLIWCSLHVTACCCCLPTFLLCPS